MSLNTFSVEGLVAWLETQDGATEYEYGSGHDCLLCRYFRARGVPVMEGTFMGGWSWLDKDGQMHPLPDPLRDLAQGSNYGEVLARAKALL